MGFVRARYERLPALHAMAFVTAAGASSGPPKPLRIAYDDPERFARGADSLKNLPKPKRAKLAREGGGDAE